MRPRTFALGLGASVLVTSLAAALSLGAAGCSSEEGETRPPTNTFRPDTGGIGADTGTPLGDSSPVDSETPDTALVDTGVPDANCFKDGGPGGATCFDCKPATNEQFLNRCTTSNCSPFANKTRIPGWDGGALPPVP